jgi:exosortase D (VPLPA-CTERM-specific)
LWQTVVLAGLLLWLYIPVLTHLVGQWWHDPDFSHGFLVPVFSAFVIWQERSRFTGLSLRPSWWGALFLGFGMCVLIVGQLGADIFLPRLSLLIVLAGLIVLFFGWSFFRALLFPWALLFLMIPIPAIIFIHITFPLQLLASNIASTILDWMNVNVVREGNIIKLWWWTGPIPALSTMDLEVAEACSGIRSLMSLTTLAVIYGYLLERRIAVRVLLVLASVPIAIAANSLRIVITALLVQHLDPKKVEGFFHEFQGWLVFVASLVMLYLLHRVICIFWHQESTEASNKSKPLPDARGGDPRRQQFGLLRFVLAAGLIAVTAKVPGVRGRTEIVPHGLPLSSFPAQLQSWDSTEIVQDKKTLEVLGHGDFVERVYQDPTGKLPYVDLFLAYFPTQRAGETPHSPQNCLPGSGWNSDENIRITLSLPGHAPFPANRYVISKAGERRLVLYWFWAHDRGIASEYWAKFYLVKDSIRMNRSDGSLVRFVTPMFPGETPDAAEQRILPFILQVFPLLDDYIPR